jgi:putative ABC transport system permease protein
VTGASLMIKATAEEMSTDFGYDTKRVLTAGISLTSARYHEPARRFVFCQSVIEKVRGIPGVKAVAIANAVPFTAGKHNFSIQGQPVVPAAERPSARYFSVSPDYFRALSISMIHGREFRESDSARAPRVAIVNRVFAERFFRGQSPLGQYIRIDEGEPAEAAWSEIVGITENIKAFFGPKEEDAQMYEPYVQAPPEPEMQIAIHTAGDANLLAPSVRSAVWSVDPDQPIGRLRTISRLIDENEGGDYVVDALLGTFGAMALLLSAVGIYGVVAYGVGQRTHEIGIRMALGAHRGDVLRSVIGQGMLLALVSACVGLVAAAPLPKLFGATLQGFRVHSLGIFICVPLVLLVVVLAAIYVPASRAARVDPMEALRYE